VVVLEREADALAERAVDACTELVADGGMLPAAAMP
jgi:hypothetical protein